MKIHSELGASDKILHCLARMIQDGEMGTNVKCLYCKYAFSCHEEFKRSGNILFVNIMQKLWELTGVMVCASLGSAHKDVLHGSWIREHPELSHQFTNISFAEQQDRLQNSDILKYGGS